MLIGTNQAVKIAHEHQVMLDDDPLKQSGLEIYFYVQLPLGQPQDLVWLPKEYFGCPSQPLSPAQSKKVKH